MQIYRKILVSVKTVEPGIKPLHFSSHSAVTYCWYPHVAVKEAGLERQKACSRWKASERCSLLSTICGTLLSSTERRKNLLEITGQEKNTYSLHSTELNICTVPQRFYTLRRKMSDSVCCCWTERSQPANIH